MKILLMGNPNVGKSAIFSRLTGIDVMISNYPGTTIELKKGKMKLDGETAEVIDVPGTYSLDPASRAEEVAVDMLQEGDLVINVVDATNLERNLNLTLALLERNIPVITVLNFWDEIRHLGIHIDVKKLESCLDIPVVPVVAVTGEGIKTLVSRLHEAKAHQKRYSEEERWENIGKIIREVQQITLKKHTLLEMLEDLSVQPLTGIPIMFSVLIVVFWTVRIVGETMIAYLFDPLFALYLPLVTDLSRMLGGGGVIHDILLGTLIAGQIDFIQSMGLLTTGLYVPLAMVLPYVVAFYLVLGILEDSGYLPRLATLVDAIFHRLGMHGLAIIPMLLGLGCNVPGALSTRILEGRKQRFIAATLMAIAVPCMAQTAMVFALLGPYGIKGLGIFFMTLFAVWLTLGFLLNRFLGGETPETFMEIPPYRIPYPASLGKKLWMRIRSFLTEAVPFVLLGVLIVNILYVFGIIGWIGEIAAPVIVGIFGLPKEAVAALIVGFLRKDVAVGMLLPLGLDMEQLIVASVVLTMYFPCVATFVVLFKELGARDLLKATAIMIVTTLLTGGILNALL
ncbi:MAG: ferrous iron transporter B [Campylobacterales bacterium]|nr:ferrous iron transporter B [Campylobacterales bacterium]HEO98818.1 ferrous iron transporter B [Campylobacterota bacterium]